MDAEKEIEEKLKQEYEMNPDLQAEFGDVTAYLAFKRAESEGRIKGRPGGVKSSMPVSRAGAGPGGGDVEAWEKEFSASKDLQREYGNDVAAYVAFKKADVAGRTKVCAGGGVVAFCASVPASEEERISDKSFSGASSRSSKEMIHRNELRQ